MGLQHELDYEVAKANALQRGVQAVAASKPGAWMLSLTLAPIDKLVHRVTKGKATAAGVLTGLPVVMVTTTGAKSGKQRTAPLLGIPVGDDLALIGGNFGQKKAPGWVYNLLADPNATLTVGGRSVDVRARLADDAEADATYAVSAPIYGGYAKYLKRTSHRETKVFVLESAG